MPPKATRRSSTGKVPNAKRPRISNPNQSSSKLKFKSPAEFFAENKNIAGFDNPGKSLYTTIRELVENGLDAAEAMDTLPDVFVSVERIGKDRFRSMVGMDASRIRIDETLYKDVESVKERKKREAKERREAKKERKKKLSSTSNAVEILDNDKITDSKQENLSSLNGIKPPVGKPDLDELEWRPEDIKDDKIGNRQRSDKSASQQLSQQSLPPPEKKARSMGGSEIFRVTVSDNGSGMAHEDVPNMMGRVLAGTKYCVRQARGKFGLGSKMALIWSKMSTGFPVHIITSKQGNEITECLLDIDIAKNIPTIIKHTRSENKANWRGTKVSVTIEGNWSTYRAKILLYMRQMAVITPYAQFRLRFDSGVRNADGKDFEMVFSRRTDQMPRPAQEVKHHPSSVNQLILKQLLGDVQASTSLVRFLTTQFVSMPRSLAVRLINELGGDFTSHMSVKELTLNHIRQIDALLHEARFEKPDGACLSPAGEYNLRLGITKELKPNLVATHAEVADVFEGHPFIVEVGVALGGTGMKPGINIFRFANRIPLLFEAGNDVVTKTARDSIRWSYYKISPTTERIGVICSIVSTKIPFKGTGKEYIGDDSESIKQCIKRAITQCCVQLKSKLVRRAAQKNAAERKKLITKYAPDVAGAIVGLFNTLEGASAETRDVWDMVREEKMTKQVLVNKLIDHVQQVDKEQAIEYATATGRDEKTLEMVFLAPRTGSNDMYVTIGNPNIKGEDVDKQVRMTLLTSLQSTL